MQRLFCERHNFDHVQIFNRQTVTVSAWIAEDDDAKFLIIKANCRVGDADDAGETFYAAGGFESECEMIDLSGSGMSHFQILTKAVNWTLTFFEKIQSQLTQIANKDYSFLGDEEVIA